MEMDIVMLIYFNWIDTNPEWPCVLGKGFKCNRRAMLQLPYWVPEKQCRERIFSCLPCTRGSIHLDWERESRVAPCAQNKPQRALSGGTYEDVGLSFTSSWRAAFEHLFKHTTSPAGPLSRQSLVNGTELAIKTRCDYLLFSGTGNLSFNFECSLRLTWCLLAPAYKHSKLLLSYWGVSRSRKVAITIKNNNNF